jgi:hypothetical protein
MDEISGQLSGGSVRVIKNRRFLRAEKRKGVTLIHIFEMGSRMVLILDFSYRQELHW